MENIRKLQGFFRIQRKRKKLKKMNGKGKQTFKVLGYDSWGGGNSQREGIQETPS